LRGYETAGGQQALLHDPLHPHWHLSEVMDRLLGLPFLGFQPDKCISPEICSARLFIFSFLPHGRKNAAAMTCQNNVCPLAR